MTGEDIVMGAAYGKTTIGALVARALGVPFVNVFYDSFGTRL
jgi:shikimate kinase